MSKQRPVTEHRRIEKCLECTREVTDYTATPEQFNRLLFSRGWRHDPIRPGWLCVECQEPIPQGSFHASYCTCDDCQEKWAA